MKADSESVTRLLKTARGQIDGILKMIDEDRYCVDISNQLMATTSILRKANTEVLRAHLHSCVKSSMEGSDDEDREQKIEEMIRIIEKSVS